VPSAIIYKNLYSRIIAGYCRSFNILLISIASYRGLILTKSQKDEEIAQD
jgi:hypothetical protein